MADYRKMYVVLLDAVEKTLRVLEEKNCDAKIARARAITELTRGELACEEIYIETADES